MLILHKSNGWKIIHLKVKFATDAYFVTDKRLRFFFYSNGNNEPIQVHVTKGSANGKIWLKPVVSIAYLVDFANTEEKEIVDIFETHAENFKQEWNEYFHK